MGDNNTGGGGSVQWEITSNRPKRHASNHNGNVVSQSGADDGAKEERDKFTVTIRFPAGWDRNTFTNALTDVPGGVKFDIPIIGSLNQIAVHWEDVPPQAGE